MNTIIFDDEYWWGGVVNEGIKMPFSRGSDVTIDLSSKYIITDQGAPFFLSSKGRYIWSEKPFKITFSKGRIVCEGRDAIYLEDGHCNLKLAYLAASRKHFPFTGTIPDELFFSVPQYNTWVELITNQNEVDILNYAKSIIDNNMPAGIIMIDGGWENNYGDFGFYPGRFSDPKGMIEKIHDMGLKVMIWVTPIICADSHAFRKLRDLDLLVKDKSGNIAIREWWSGYSSVLDLTNPKAQQWLSNELDNLINDYGVDGFKLDAGDAYFYDDNDIIYQPMLAHDHTTVFGQFGLKYKFNEFRAAWKNGGQPLVMRLGDKSHSWQKNGINSLIPNALVQGMLGYTYNCPDMIGGGSYIDFLSGSETLDQELIVRYAQCSALFPMMQFSVAPWRVLSKENFNIVKNTAFVHGKFGDEILALAHHASKTGEPITRHMAYEFPDEGFENTLEQFMLGSRILVAPIVKKSQWTKNVKLPNGRWISDTGEEYIGGQTITIDTPLERLPYFTLLS